MLRLWKCVMRNFERLIVEGLAWMHDCLYLGTVHHLVACVFSWRSGNAAIPEPNDRSKRLKEA